MKPTETFHKETEIFEKNIGPINRVARLFLGIIFILCAAFVFKNPAYLQFIFIFIGVLLILEAALGYCIWHGLRGTKDLR